MPEVRIESRRGQGIAANTHKFHLDSRLQMHLRGFAYNTPPVRDVSRWLTQALTGGWPAGSSRKRCTGIENKRWKYQCVFPRRHYRWFAEILNPVICELYCRLTWQKY